MTVLSDKSIVKLIANKEIVLNHLRRQISLQTDMI